MYVSVAKAEGHLPLAYHKYVPDRCEWCGERIACNASFTMLNCSNVKCNRKLAFRMRDMLRNFGVKGMGVEYCQLIVDENNLTNHVKLFELEEADYPSKYWGNVNSENFKKVQDILNKPIEFKYLMKNLGITGMKENALKVFEDIADLEDLANAISYAGSIPSFVYMQTGQDGQQGENYVRAITDFRDEIALAGSIFKIITPPKAEIKIAITGTIRKLGTMTRFEFIDYLNHLGEGLVKVRDSKAFASVEYTVADTPSNSKTYLAGTANGNLIDSKKMKEIVLEEVSKWKEESPEK